MNNRSDRRLRYFAGRTLVSSGLASTAAQGPERGAARQDERVQRFEALVELVAPSFEAFDVGLGHAQRRVLGVRNDRRREIRAGVEQVVLDLAEHVDDLLGRGAECESDADARVRFVAVRVRDEPWIVLGHAGEIAQPGSAVVAGPGVNPRQVNSHGATVPLGRSGVVLARLFDCE